MLKSKGDPSPLTDKGNLLSLQKTLRQFTKTEKEESNDHTII